SDHLYVTFFSGHGNVAEEIKIRDIWRCMGVDSSRILHFSPGNYKLIPGSVSCGPRSTIHYDTLKGRSGVPQFKNYDKSIVTMWKINFTESITHADGSVSALDTLHVDT
ncbi:hypothetical protein PENTCL1PPCAC_8261, partial [Pristionchus entomophagus]